MEYLRICMEKESYTRFCKERERNPFLVIPFYYVIPNLFQVKNKKEPEVKDEAKTGIQAMIDARKKASEEMNNKDKVVEDVPFMEFITNFLLKTEQSYSCMDNLRYTQILSISENLGVIREKDKKAEEAKKAEEEGTVPLSTVATNLGGGKK